MMMSIVLAILITLVASTLFGHVVHWSLHQSWMGRFNTAHMTHHLKLYPPGDYSSDEYRSAGKDASTRFFAVAALPLILAPLILLLVGFISWPVALVILFVEGAIGFLHNYMHDAFHINNHWLNKIPVINRSFDRWNKIHYIHHIDMSKNYGIFTFFWDRLFGTYQL